MSSAIWMTSTSISGPAPMVPSTAAGRRREMKSHRLQKMLKRRVSADRTRRARLTLARAGLVALATGLGLPGAAQAQHLPDLVTPNVLRVCADPANMPFSNREGKGFENRIAAILADELKVRLRYYWMRSEEHTSELQ